MKPVYTALLALTSACVLTLSPPAQSATAAGQPATERREVGDFDAIALAGSMDLNVRQAAKAGVEVQADDALLPLIETVVESGSAGRTLHIRFRRGQWLHDSGPVHVTVDVVNLSSLAAAGSGDVVVQALKTPSLKLALSGSSDARLNGLDTEALEVHISGSGDLVAAGRAKRVRLGIAGSGDARLAGLQADDVRVRIAGSGDADVTANRSLDVSVAGSGDVRYGGAATDVKSSMVGSGSLSRR